MAESSLAGHHGSPDKPPVLILGFARMQNIIEIGERILQSQPCCLFVQIDGGKFEARSQEVENLALLLARMASSSTKVHVAVEDSNVGIARNLTRGVEAVFVDHRSAIILEDDCYPAPVFYEFMATALRLHSDNKQIGMISANAYIRYGRGPLFAELSNVPQTWGWATWSDRWKGFDVELSKYSREQRELAISNYSRNPFVRSHWRKRIADSISDRNMWDAQWSAYMWLRRYQCINPSENLVKNTGVDQSATHTFAGSIFSDWDKSDRRDLTENAIQAIAAPREWSWTRRLQHGTLLRLSLVSSLFEKWWPQSSRSVSRKLAHLIATRRHPSSEVQ